MTMIERVARALEAATGDYETMARAALAVIREPIDDDSGDILERLRSSAAYMDEKSRDRFVITAEDLYGAIVEIEGLRHTKIDAALRGPIPMI